MRIALFITGGSPSPTQPLPRCNSLNQPSRSSTPLRTSPSTSSLLSLHPQPPMPSSSSRTPPHPAPRHFFTITAALSGISVSCRDFLSLFVSYPLSRFPRFLASARGSSYRASKRVTWRLALQGSRSSRGLFSEHADDATAVQLNDDRCWNVGFLCFWVSWSEVWRGWKIGKWIRISFSGSCFVIRVGTRGWIP